MRRPHQRPIPQRRRVFVGCEGESEGGYAVFLGKLLEAEHRRIHLDAVLLGGGDPLAIVETATKQLRKRAARGEPYVARVVFLDADRNHLTPERTEQAIRLAEGQDMQLVWQDADSDDAAHLFRDDRAHHSEMMPPIRGIFVGGLI